ncbi:hypothetical protein [Colwellia sp. BRX8-9]|uniref:hypothetical protein n=1 Tax=Colwellia sp. BRX8-9 TaxID=2759831 RepID=UPI0015F71AD4|nr:hypothetical protein [Colwellia sp. BRX8-9]MBA6350055.1 hypothetical protein [Colwellia sp. BRX8-9]
MNKVIQTIYAVKVLESLGAIERRSNKIPQAELQLAPMLHWVVNFFACYGCMVMGIILFAFSPLESVKSGAIISLLIFLCFSIKEWYEMWEDRAEEIRVLHIAEVYSWKELSEAEMHKLALSISNRPSHVLLSYILYFVPHALFSAHFYSMF